VTLFEAEGRAGGHTATVDIDYDGTPIAVDTGFIVYNEHNYHDLTALFAHLNVATHESDMGFSLSLDGGIRGRGLEPVDHAAPFGRGEVNYLPGLAVEIVANVHFLRPGRCKKGKRTQGEQHLLDESMGFAGCSHGMVDVHEKVSLHSINQGKVLPC